MPDIICLSNTMTDIIVNVTDEELAMFGLKKAYNNRIRKEQIGDFESFVFGKSYKCVPGGSPSNVANGASRLGLKAMVLGSVGDDSLGNNYIDYLVKSGIEPHIKVNEGRSGIVYVLVTPEGEKTSIGYINCSAMHNFELSGIQKAGIFHTSGYELAANPKRTLETLCHMKNLGARISYDLADPIMLERSRKSLTDVLSSVNILFMTEDETEALTGRIPKKALKTLSSVIDIVILKMGANGSIVRSKGEEYYIPTYPAKVKNTNGAGDAYAAAFLNGLIGGYKLKACGHLGSQFAAKICEIDEPHF